ncbi:MAG TPA: heme biosynthesis HemY N-terminal domain-containing protein, partial [Alphaproteobacteria bacterium]|nr:heme biosynthesis HemY N-terminal domain-containing protein [Alphaproteobacteria bacterium]
MIRALWFMLKLAVLIAAAVFLASQPGEMSLHWGAYKIQLALGLFLAGLFVLILIALSVYRLLRAIADIPGFFARRAQITRRDKAYQSLAQGLSAVAAGDARMAVKMSRRVQGLLEDHGGLPLLLEAQAARLEGREDEALNLFLQLADSKEAGFLGIRGLLAAALERGDSVRALGFARRGLEMHPRQPWLLQMTLDLEIQSRDF